MKTRVWNYLLPLFLISGTAAIAQEQNDASVPGDNFSLEGALDLFKKSASPEEFEKMLNSSDSKVNNLDLNGDGEIDYIRVIDKNEGDVHAFILQSVISKNESQDVAVIELEKLGDGRARLQIIGDEDVYGQETIIEPTQDVRVNAGTSTSRATVNVWAWPSVQYVYAPYYNPWISPWSYAYYPGWWSPWSPVAYAVYNPWWTPYRAYYSPCYSFRIGYAHRIYRPYRTTSVIVYNRHSNQINHYRSQHNSNNYYSPNGRSRNDRSSYADGNNNRHSGNNSRSNYTNNSNSRNSNDRNNNRSSWSGGSNSRSTWRSTNDNNRSNNNSGGRTSSNFSNGSSNNNSNLSNQQRSSWGNRSSSNSGNTNLGGATRSNNNWQRPSSSGSSMGRGSSNSSPSFSRPQGNGGGSRSSSGGGNGGGASHSGGNSRGRH